MEKKMKKIINQDGKIVPIANFNLPGTRVVRDIIFQVSISKDNEFTIYTLASEEQQEQLNMDYWLTKAKEYVSTPKTALRSFSDPSDKASYIIDEDDPVYTEPIEKITVKLVYLNQFPDHLYNNIIQSSNIESNFIITLEYKNF